jgi:ubiquitin conjugation factor E4 B
MMRLSNGMFRLLVVLAQQMTHAFTSDTFGESMAHMLTYYIQTLVGPKVQNLRVKEPEKYHFRPKDLLRDILRVFVACCADHAGFRAHVVRDERAYSPALMRATAALVQRTALLPRAEALVLARIVTELEASGVAAGASVALEDDAPDEFVDPITGVLMRDPVVLPSKSVCDRRTIKRHLLTQPTDPFTQLPMREDELVDDVEMRARIEAWIAARPAAAEASQPAASE